MRVTIFLFFPTLSLPFISYFAVNINSEALNWKKFRPVHADLQRKCKLRDYLIVRYKAISCNAFSLI